MTSLKENQNEKNRIFKKVEYKIMKNIKEKLKEELRKIEQLERVRGTMTTLSDNNQPITLQPDDEYLLLDALEELETLKQKLDEINDIGKLRRTKWSQRQRWNTPD